MTHELERELGRAFRRADLPLAPDGLRQFLLELPVSAGAGDVTARGPRPWQLPRDLVRVAATLALFALLGAALYWGRNALPVVGPPQSPSATPTVQASPSPEPSPSPAATPAETLALPDPAQLLADFPEAEMAFERSVGFADRPRSDDERVEEVDLGALLFSRDVVLGAACLGPGALTVEARWVNVPGAIEAFPAVERPCDGQPTEIRYQPAFEGAALELRRVIVPAGASWRLAIGQLPDRGAPPATLAPISGTDGWWRLWDAELDQVDPSTGIGAGVRVGDDVTRLGVWVECQDGESVTLEVLHEAPSSNADLREPVTCSATSPDRFEVAVEAGETITVKATPSSPIAVRLFIEADAMPVSTWGDVPAVTQDVAGAPFIASNGSLVALGRLGETRQTLLPLAGINPTNQPGGDHVAIPFNLVGGPVLHVFDVDSGESLGVIAEHAPGTFISETWVDPIHERVFYTTFAPDTTTVTAYTVGLDGAGRTQLASSAADGAGTHAFLSLDYASFIIDSCTAAACRRTVVDPAPLAIRTFDFSVGAEVCDAVGATDGLVVLRVAESCTASPPEEVVVVDTRGNERLRIVDPGSLHLLRTSDGPVLLTRGLSDAAMQVLDLQTGSSSPLAVDAPALAPVSGVQLPADWVLLAPFFGIGDFPIHPSMLLGEPPLLVNVVTGETIEMTNLPH